MKTLICLASVAALATLTACEGEVQPRPEPTLVPIEDECPEGEPCK
jgi:hypothetical protein